MLLDPNARFLVRHELKFRSYRERGKPLSFATLGTKVDAANIIENAIADSLAVLPLENNDAISITALDVRDKDHLAILLFRRSDPDASTPVFEHMKTKKIRLADKRVDEAEAISAHLFIDLREYETPNPTNRAILEEMPGLGRSFVEALMRALMREHKYNFRDEHGETKETYTIPYMHGVPSETLGGALSGGGIKYVELVRPPKIKGLDVAGLIPHPERMRIGVKATSRKGMLDSIARVRDWAYHHDWKNLRVQVETEDKRFRVVDIARNTDAADVLFVHSEPITLENRVNQCTDTINEELVEHAKAIFAKKWK